MISIKIFVVLSFLFEVDSFLSEFEIDSYLMSLSLILKYLLSRVATIIHFLFAIQNLSEIYIVCHKSSIFYSYSWNEPLMKYIICSCKI